MMVFQIWHGQWHAIDANYQLEIATETDRDLLRKSTSLSTPQSEARYHCCIGDHSSKS